MDGTLRVLVDNEVKRKAMFVLKCKGSTISEEVRKICDKYAKEFDEQYGKEE